MKTKKNTALSLTKLIIKTRLQAGKPPKEATYK